MKAQIMKFWNDEEGATAIEYGLIAGLVAVAIIAALGAMSTELSTLFGKIKTALEAKPAATQ